MKHTLLIVLSLLGAATLAGCQSTGPSGPSSGGGSGSEAFSDQDFGWSTAGGGDAVDGVLAYRGGPAAFTCGDVVLMPMTPWSRARMRILYGSDSSAVVSVSDVVARTPPASPDYRKYARHATCDAADHFNFGGLPDGAWFVITAATPVAGGDKLAIMRRVDTHGGVRHVNLP
jgi:hypothetical protein